MSMSIPSREVKISPEDYAKLCGPPQDARLVQDVNDPAMNYDSLSESEYLDVVWGEMKAMFNGHNFEDNKKLQVEVDGEMCTYISYMRWPVAPSASSQLYDRVNRIPFSSILWPTTIMQSYNTDNFNAETEIIFNVPHHKMIARYEGSFHIKNAVIRAKFVGDEYRHAFSIGEYEKLLGDVCIGRINGSDKESPLAFLIDNRNLPQPVFAELEEFTMLAVTDGRYYKNYMQPRVVNEDLALFTCYNKARKLSCDTVASFKDGLCDPETIFSGSAAEDVPASWTNNLPK